MSIPMATFTLLDGALLHGTTFHGRVLGEPGIRLLYEDKGPQAARMGPLLLPERQEISRQVNRLARIHSDMVFAYSLLRAPVSPEQILEHLQRLRFVHASGGKRYYFRFADGRAFASVWRTLSVEQRSAALGPVQGWHHYDPAGRQCCARTSPLPSTSPANILPLQLQPRQWHQVLNATRVAELFFATSNMNNDGPPAQGSRAQRYAWTTQIHERLERLQLRETSVRIAATRVVWQTAGYVLGDEQFEIALKEANCNGDISGILVFGHLSLPQGRRR